MPDPIIVTRKIAIDPGSKKQDVSVAVNRLKSLSGVKMALHNAQRACIEVEYDQLKTNFSDVEITLQKEKIHLSSGIKNRFLSTWYKYLDTTARDNANAPPAACCNKPPRRPR